MEYTFQQWWDTLESSDAEFLKSKFTKEAVRHFNSFYRNKETLIKKEVFEQIITQLC